MNIINLTRIYLRNTFNTLVEIAAAGGEEYEAVLQEKYNEVDEISIDYGIMEKSHNIYVIPADFGWDDVGTWHSVERYRKKDENNNVCVGDITNLHSFNNIAFGKGKPIVLAGLNDVFVVESEDMIFIGRKEEIEKIKEIKREVC
jgi:mannose-1-phosphate guanylyltransferase